MIFEAHCSFIDALCYIPLALKSVLCHCKSVPPMSNHEDFKFSYCAVHEAHTPREKLAAELVEIACCSASKRHDTQAAFRNKHSPDRLDTLSTFRCLQNCWTSKTLENLLDALAKFKTLETTPQRGLNTKTRSSTRNAAPKRNQQPDRSKNSLLKPRRGLPTALFKTHHNERERHRRTGRLDGDINGISHDNPQLNSFDTTRVLEPNTSATEPERTATKGASPT